MKASKAQYCQMML